MKRGLMVAAMVLGMTFISVFSASAADFCGKLANREAFRHYKQEAAPLIAALQAKRNTLDEENAYGVGEAYALKFPDIGKIEQLESDIKALEGEIGAVAAKYGIAQCCRI